MLEKASRSLVRQRAAIGCGSLDLSLGVLKIMHPLGKQHRRIAPIPLADALLIVWEVILSTGRGRRAPRAQSDTICSRAYEGGEN